MDLLRGRAPGRRAEPSGAAESWFLERGLPSVLTRRGRWRRLWTRSAPVLAAYAALQACVLALYLITGGHDIQIAGQPTSSELAVLVILAVALPLTAAVGWLVSRSRNRKARSAIATASALFVACVGVVVADVVQAAIVVAAVLILTGGGIGSVVGWAVRMMVSHFATVGALAVRALPVVLLTALVFFNTYVWLMAATISGNRLALAMGFLVSIAAAFVTSATRERVRPMLDSATAPHDEPEKLSGTPFATMPNASGGAPLKKAERLNVIFVLAASQLAQILVVAAVTTAIYLILGLIVLSPELLNEWTHTYRSTATVLGFTVPVPDSLIHMTLFLGALTFMYISARAAGDAEYRSTFLDPLIEDLHTTLVARNRYRGAAAASVRPVDGADTSD